ncbi:putative membrane protein YdjX (TVP38/TMEM64 family) [Alteromonadaceae bacterium 2753L.S.0a.02]|nr:putative membrane protein YdjX (TVP38/TMEM64 family) [Alteromonadaceae bacterium 2753L.S.0a.02]
MIRNTRAVSAPSKSARLRLVIFISVIVCGWLIFYHSPLASWFNDTQIQNITEQIRSLWWAPLVLIAAYLGCALSGVPSAPLFVAGAVFGPIWGTFYNTLGLTCGAIAGFTLARTLGQDFVLQTTGPRFYRVQRFFTRFGFWPLVQARFLPIPDTVLNFSAALAGVPWNLYLVASLVGLLPSTLIHTVCISQLFVAPDNHTRAVIGALYLGSFVVLNLVIGGPWLLTQWQRRKRYKTLVLQRRQNNPSNRKTA